MSMGIEQCLGVVLLPTLQARNEGWLRHAESNAIRSANATGRENMQS